MKTEITKETVIKLTVTPAEAYWIKSVSQNYLGHKNMENPSDSKIRESIFNGLPPFCQLGRLLEEV